MNEEIRNSLPDCTDCSGCSSGTCSTDNGGCASGCGGCGIKAEQEDLPEGPLGAEVSSREVMGWRREPRGKLFATNWLDNISTSADFPVVQVQFKNTRAGFYQNPSHLNLEIGDMVAVEASPGHDIGQVTMVGPLVRMQMKKAKADPENLESLKKVFRKARTSDIEKYDEARGKEHDTMIRSRAIAEELGLNMKIGDVEYQGDGGKAIFYYIADERVDFRKLIRILAEEFHVRIEMKQIGARQEAGRIGGIGPCGRPLCCSSWMTHFVSVGTGAARMQDLSMNPQKLAGQCAKLKCCLNFEIDAYAESVKKIPPKDAVLQTKESDYYLFKTDILTRVLTYSTDRHIGANLVTISAARAFEIIALNKQGVKVDALASEDSDEVENREYIDLTDQDSLTRFDKAKKKRSKASKHKNQSKDSSGSSKTEKNAENPQPAVKEKKKQEAPQNEGKPKEGSSGKERRQKRQQRQKEQKGSKQKPDTEKAQERN